MAAMTEFKPGYYETRLHEKAEVESIGKTYLFGCSADGLPCAWHKDGKFIADESPHGMHPQDLIGPWQEKLKPVSLAFWIVIYPSPDENGVRVCGYPERPTRLAGPSPAIMRRVRYEEGKGITDITEEA